MSGERYDFKPRSIPVQRFETLPYQSQTESTVIEHCSVIGAWPVVLHFELKLPVCD